MKRFLTVLVAVLAIAATSALARDEGTTCQKAYYQVRGKKGRKYIRHFLLRLNLPNDERVIYETYGYTPHRLRIDFGSRITEQWRYYSEGLEFTFDKHGNLIQERRIPREDGHIE